jgi:hypothetical protein
MSYGWGVGVRGWSALWIGLVPSGSGLAVEQEQRRTDTYCPFLKA